MKLPSPYKHFSQNSDLAFTAIEMIISTTIIMLTVIALVSAEIYGTRVYTLAATQLTATQSARNALDQLREEIQSANGIMDVGNYVWANGSPTNFQMIGYGTNQVGNAVRIQPGAESGTNFVLTGPYTLIFLQPGNGTTNFVTTGSSGNLINTNNLIMETFDTNYNPVLTNVLASYITNQYIFTATDYTGTNIMTNSVNNRVLQVTLMFSEWEYPIAIIGTNDINAYDYYRLQTRITRRAINF